MQVDLSGQTYHVAGVRHIVADAVLAGLRANGADARWTGLAEPDATIDGLVVSHSLDPADTAPDPALLAFAAGSARRMAERGAGRVVHLLTTMGLVPMRRHPEFSVAQAGIVASIRTLAMVCGPAVRVNGVAAGCIAEAGGMAAGEAAMLGHVASGRSGTVGDLVHAVLFLCDPLNSYTTGQVLAVDGGWTAGYARNF